MGGPVIFAFAFSLLVALYWLKRFRKMDKYEKEPERLVYFVFFAGALATIPSVILESPLQYSRSDQTSSLSKISSSPFYGWAS